MRMVALSSNSRVRDITRKTDRLEPLCLAYTHRPCEALLGGVLFRPLLLKVGP